MSCHLEVGDLADTRRVLARLGLSHAQLFARDESDDHIAQMEAGLSSLAADGATFVLTGRAPAIQRLRQRLRQLDVPSARVMTKAYWSPGKAGLD
jgi:NADPH-dependent ferric siderophore reductase